MPSKDFILPISFNTAQEIGLEESVLIAFLEQHAFMLSSRTLSFEMVRLSAQLPFWTGPMLQRILSSLQANQILNFERQGSMLLINLEGNQEVRESEQTQSFSPAPIQQVSHQQSSGNDDEIVHKLSRLQHQAQNKESHQTPNSSSFKGRKNLAASHNQIPRKQEQAAHQPLPKATSHAWPSKNKDEKRRGVSDFDLYLEQKERTRQPDQWQPEESTLEQITQAGVNRQFALQLLPEFLLRIKEQRKNVRTWNSEFFKYVKRQWQYKQSDRSSYEGTQSSSYNSRTSKEQVSDALTNIHDTDW